MRDTDLFELALGLVPPWMVKACSFDAEARRLDIENPDAIGQQAVVVLRCSATSVRANFRPERVQQGTMARLLRTYSITSVAVASRAGEIVIPSVFAVLMLMTSSYLVGACTGRSPGFSPLRMRST